MNQTEECATKRVFGIIIWYDNVVIDILLDILAGLTVFCLVTGLSHILIIVLFQELIVSPYGLQAYCMSVGLS